jgi:hypothetical protein
MDIQPNFYINNPNNQSAPPKKWWQTKKIGLAIVGIIILGEVVWSIFALSSPTANSTKNTNSKTSQAEVNKSASVISLVGPNSIKAGEEFKVDVKIDTQGALADGMDLVIKYDPKFIEVVNPEVPMVLNKIFSNFPVNSADATSGLITVSAVSSPGDPSFSGQAVLGSLNFKAIQLGPTSISLDFTKGSTTDSNVVETTSGNDILEMVNNLDITINN